MNIKPGDLFEWVYRCNNKSVLHNEKLYSYTMSKHVLCSGVCLCIGINDNIIYWFSNNRLLHARVTTAEARFALATWAIIPRKTNL